MRRIASLLCFLVTCILVCAPASAQEPQKPATAPAPAQEPQKPAPAQEPQKPAAASTDTALPPVSQILEKYVSALGGKAAFEKITSRVSKGSTDVVDRGARGTIEIYQKAPNRVLGILDFEGYGTVRHCFDGTAGWGDDPQNGFRQLSGAELEAMKRNSTFHRELKLAELYPKMRVAGKEKLSDNEVYVVEAIAGEGPADKFYFDVASGLLVREVQERTGAQGKVTMDNRYGDYREVDGVKMPFKIRLLLPDVELLTTLSEVKHNVPIEDAKFAMPPAK